MQTTIDGYVSRVNFYTVLPMQELCFDGISAVKRNLHFFTFLSISKLFRTPVVSYIPSKSREALVIYFIQYCYDSVQVFLHKACFVQAIAMHKLRKTSASIAPFITCFMVVYFITVKKGMRQAVSNGIINQLINERDEMW